MDPFTLSTSELIVRLLVATVLGALVGAERSRVGKTAGMRTYALVSLGSALFTVMSTYIAVRYANSYQIDPLRVASQIVVGIGFLGAGIIFVQKNVVTGLTTAAGLWVVAALGMASGLGLYALAGVTTILTLFIFEALWYLELKFFIHKEDPEGGSDEIIDKRRNAHREAQD
jgi:putative Mg2+ transporter-C (MgtC) family protein